MNEEKKNTAITHFLPKTGALRYTVAQPLTRYRVAGYNRLAYYKTYEISEKFASSSEMLLRKRDDAVEAARVCVCGLCGCVRGRKCERKGQQVG